MDTPKQLHFDEVAIGTEIPRLEKAPLTTMHLMRWSAAMENWHRIHYDHPFAIGHDKLPGVLINGSFKQNFIAQALKDWAGLEGWVWKISFQFRQMDVAPSALWVWASVKGKEPVNDQFGLVTLDLGIVNADERESTPGTAIVALPTRGGKVPYPFDMPARAVA